MIMAYELDEGSVRIRPSAMGKRVIVHLDTLIRPGMGHAVHGLRFDALLLHLLAMGRRVHVHVMVAGRDALVARQMQRKRVEPLLSGGLVRGPNRQLAQLYRTIDLVTHYDSLFKAMAKFDADVQMICSDPDSEGAFASEADVLAFLDTA